MLKAKFSSMQMQALYVSTTTIQAIAQDRSPKPSGIGSVNPELMGTSCQGKELHTSEAPNSSNDLEPGYAGLTSLPIDFLIRAIARISPKWQ